jgi:hypothetical protein
MEVCRADRKKTGKAGSGSTAKKQPAQSPGDRGHAADHETVRRGYDAAQEPEAQGDGDPGVDQITETHDKG